MISTTFALLFLSLIAKGECLTASAACPNYQIKVTHDGCRVCVAEGAPSFLNKDGTVSFTRFYASPDAFDDGDYIYRSCIVKQASVKYLGIKPFCQEKVGCVVGHVDTKEADFHEETQFTCGIVSASDGCSKKSWQNCYLDPTPIDELASCGADSPQPLTGACSKYDQGHSRGNRSNGTVQ